MFHPSRAILCWRIAAPASWWCAFFCLFAAAVNHFPYSVRNRLPVVTLPCDRNIREHFLHDRRNMLWLAPASHNGYQSFPHWNNVYLASSQCSGSVASIERATPAHVEYSSFSRRIHQPGAQVSPRGRTRKGNGGILTSSTPAAARISAFVP